MKTVSTWAAKAGLSSPLDPMLIMTYNNCLKWQLFSIHLVSSLHLFVSLQLWVDGWLLYVVPHPPDGRHVHLSHLLLFWGEWNVVIVQILACIILVQYYEILNNSNYFYRIKRTNLEQNGIYNNAGKHKKNLLSPRKQYILTRPSQTIS